MSAQTSQQTAKRRMRMRIRAVKDEWVRNPWLLALPGFVLLLAALADSVASAGLYALASSFALLSHAAVFVLLALLSVAFVRL